MEQPTEISRFTLVRSGRDKDTQPVWAAEYGGMLNQRRAGVGHTGQAASQGEVEERPGVGLQGRAGGNASPLSPGTSVPLGG